MKPLPIGILAKETGVKIPTIRFYENIGLLPEPDRADNNRRTYGPDSVRRLRFIRHARELGFEIDAIRQLLDMAGDPDRCCGEAHEKSVGVRAARELDGGRQALIPPYGDRDRRDSDGVRPHPELGARGAIGDPGLTDSGHLGSEIRREAGCRWREEPVDIRKHPSPLPAVLGPQRGRLLVLGP